MANKNIFDTFKGNIYSGTAASSGNLAAREQKAKDLFEAGKLVPAKYFSGLMKHLVDTPSEEYKLSQLFRNIPVQRGMGTKVINHRWWEAFRQVDTLGLGIPELVEPELKSLKMNSLEMTWEINANGIAVTDEATVMSYDGLWMEAGKAIVYNQLVTRDYIYRNVMKLNCSSPTGGIFVGANGNFVATKPSAADLLKFKLIENVEKLVTELRANRVPGYSGDRFKLVIPRRAVKWLQIHDSIITATVINTNKTRESVFSQILSASGIDLFVIDDRIATVCPIEHEASNGDKSAPTKADFIVTESDTLSADNKFDVCYVVGGNNLFKAELRDSQTSLGDIIIKDFNVANKGYLNRFATFGYKFALGAKVFYASQLKSFLVPNFHYTG